MLQRNNQLQEALQSFTKVLEIIGEDRLVYESRGLVYFDFKDYHNAINDFNKTIQIEPTYSEGYYLRGLCLIKLNRLKDSIEDFNEAIQLGGTNPGIYAGIGQAYRFLKNYEKGLYYLNESLKKSPGNDAFLS